MTTTANGRKTASTASTSTSRSGIIIPQRASELQALCQQQRALNNSMEGDLADLAAVLRTALPGEIQRRGGARTELLGLDARIMARRVAKPIVEIAALHRKIAELWVVEWTRYQMNVQNVRTLNHTGTRMFDSDH